MSDDGSSVRIRTPGRYLVCATPEPSAVDVANKKRGRQDLVVVVPPKKRQRLAFKVRVKDNPEANGAALRSSVYVGVATRAFCEVSSLPSSDVGAEPAARPVHQAVKSSDAWLVDLRRGRYVHAYPDYDRRVAATRGVARARALASTDDVVASGDVVGVKVVDQSVFFYKNGSRLAFGCGGGVVAPVAPRLQQDQLQNQNNLAWAHDYLYDHLGWGRPLPRADDQNFIFDPPADDDDDAVPRHSRGTDLLPVIEVHAKARPEDGVCDLELEIASWNPDDHDDCFFPDDDTTKRTLRTRPPQMSLVRQDDDDDDDDYHHHQEATTQQEKSLFLDFQGRREEEVSSLAADECAKTRNNLFLPGRKNALSLVSRFMTPSRGKRKTLRTVSRSLLARLPAAVGLGQLTLDLASLALSPSHFRSLRGFCDAFALSVAVSTVWKTHFYDHRRPRRSRRGLRILLKVHLFKCVALALFAAFYLEPRFFRSSQSLFLPATSLQDDDDDDDCARTLPRAMSAAAAWLVSEIAVEICLQFVAFLEACYRKISLCAMVSGRALVLDGSRYVSLLGTSLVHQQPPPPEQQQPQQSETNNNNTNNNNGNNTGLLGRSSQTRRQRSLARGQGLAAALRNFPVGHDAPLATARAILRFFFMIFLVPGSASLVLALAKDRFLNDCQVLQDADPFLLDATSLLKSVFYPVVAAWWCFALFVKFGFLVFGLHALCGFEDYYAPGWLLG